MGHIAEPKGIDFIVAPSTLTDADTKAIHIAIANYKKSHEAVNTSSAAPLAMPKQKVKATS